MIRKLSLTLAGAVAASALLLSGCGGAAQTGSDAPAPEAQPSSQAQGSSSAPSDSSGGSETGGKPAKEEVVAGFAKYWESNGLPKDKAEKVASCIVDAMYDQAKPKTMTAFKDGEPTKMDVSDTTAFGKVSGECAKEAA
ncbi:hypothetical protein [Microlunatus sp. GCM10028923]|uniref:hypothetical protein n=1 Tax=Microlunatus sp. GCM10028923 TaxID=3273400 RepID=UPI003622DE79